MTILNKINPIFESLYNDEELNLRFEEVNKLTTSILEMLIENGADIYYIGEEKMNELYRKFIQNVIFNQDICQGVEDNEKEQWKKSWGSMESIVRPFYMKNNPYYG